MQIARKGSGKIVDYLDDFVWPIRVGCAQIAYKRSNRRDFNGGLSHLQARLENRR